MEETEFLSYYDFLPERNPSIVIETWEDFETQALIILIGLRGIFHRNTDVVKARFKIAPEKQLAGYTASIMEDSIRDCKDVLFRSVWE